MSGHDIKPQHTAGPWKALRDEVWVGRRRICAHVAPGESLPIGDDFQRACANARLIAAAPEMLQALRTILGHYEQHNITNHDGAALDYAGNVGAVARAAIKKATEA